MFLLNIIPFILSISPHKDKVGFSKICFPSPSPMSERINTSLILSNPVRSRQNTVCFFGKVSKKKNCFYKLHLRLQHNRWKPNQRARSSDPIRILFTVDTAKYLFFLETDFCVFQVRCLELQASLRAPGSAVEHGLVYVNLASFQVQPRNSHSVHFFSSSSQVSTLFMNAVPHAITFTASMKDKNRMELPDSVIPLYLLRIPKKKLSLA